MPTTLPAASNRRPTGVAGVDRRIGLNERNIGVAGQRAAFGTDDASGGALIEPERGAIAST